MRTFLRSSFVAGDILGLSDMTCLKSTKMVSEERNAVELCLFSFSKLEILSTSLWGLTYQRGASARAACKIQNPMLVFVDPEL